MSYCLILFLFKAEKLNLMHCFCYGLMETSNRPVPESVKTWRVDNTRNIRRYQ